VIYLAAPLWLVQGANEVTEVVRAWLLRRGWLVALVAGVLWVANDLAGRLSPDPDDWDCNSLWDYATNALDLAAFFLTAAAVVALHVRQRHRSGTLGKVGAVAAFLGCVGAGVNNPLEHCGGVEILGLVLWVPATLLLTLGLLLLGVATARARVLPAWAGPSLVVGVAATFLAADAGGRVALGLAWVAVGCALWLAGNRRPAPPAGAPPPLCSVGHRRYPPGSRTP
jgi:hypothetical protein